MAKLEEKPEDKLQAAGKADVSQATATRWLNGKVLQTRELGTSCLGLLTPPTTRLQSFVMTTQPHVYSGIQMPSGRGVRKVGGRQRNHQVPLSGKVEH